MPLPPDTRRRLAHLLLQGGRHADSATALRQYAVLFADAYEATREACLAASLSDMPKPAELFARATACLLLPADDFLSARRPAPETARFSDAFFGGLAAPPSLDGFATVHHGGEEPHGTGPTILVTFDDGYARRFVRAREMLANGTEILVTDADNILWRNATDALGSDYDLSLAADRRRIPWFSYNVSLVHLRNTAGCRTFMDLVAGYIARFLRSGEARWHLDQNAFFCTADWLGRHGRAPLFASLTGRASRMIERRIRAEELPPAGG